MALQLKAWYAPIPDDPTKLLVTSPQLFEQVIRWLRGRPLIFDYETSGLAWWAHARICGIALASWDDHGVIRNFYIPVRHQTGEQQLDMAVVGPAVQSLLEDQYTLKIAHNIKFEDHMSRREGWRIQGPRFDTMIAARLYDENAAVALKGRAKSDLNYPNADDWEKRLDEEVVRLAKMHRLNKTDYLSMFGYSQVNIALAGRYACWDTQFTGELWQLYGRAWDVTRFYPRIWPNEMKLTRHICNMEEVGMLLDIPYLVALRERAEGIKQTVEHKLHGMLGYRMFNLGSDDELRRYLLRDLGLPLYKQTKKYKLSVDRDALEEFSQHAEQIPLILEWRDAEKVVSTYTTSLIDKADANGRVHGEFNQVGTNTGRLSANNPNLQNITTDDPDRAKHYGVETDPLSVKRAFKIPDNAIRFYADYSQVELRVLAKYSMDPIMVDAFVRGEDLHNRTSMEVFGTIEGPVRRTAKMINFGLSYCLTAAGLARNAKIPLPEAEGHMARFFQRYHGIAEFRDRFWAQARANGNQFSSMWGRTRRLPDLSAYLPKHRNRAERQAIGTLIQGTAAELTRESIVRIGELIETYDWPADLTCTVHDEIQTDVYDQGFAPVVAKGIKDEMERFPEFHPVPILVDVKASTTNWAEKTHYEV